MAYKSLERIAAEIPLWRLLECKFPGVEAMIVRPLGGDETVTFPNDDGPTPDVLKAARAEMAAEIFTLQYVEPRQAAFSQRPIGAQLDAIIKGLKAVADSGVALPEETMDLISWSDGIKAANPKPERGG